MQANEEFRSGFGFLMAATGFAVGLGNIWRFPYITGENGGAAFVLVYLACAVVIGIPIVMAELLIGRRGQASPPDAMARVAIGEGGSGRWRNVGRLNLATAFVIEATYCVVAGWVLWYLARAILTGFAGVDAAAASDGFADTLGNVGGLMFWTFASLAVTGLIVFFGVNDGIERSVRVLMPTLFLLMVCLVNYNMVNDGFDQAIDYLFTPDFSKVTPGMILAAIGQAFFSIGVAMAGMMVFGAYLPSSFSIARGAVMIILIDTVVALLAGLMIFPIVFRFGLDPAGGTGLIFQTLPIAFAQMPGGQFVAIIFFLLLSVAAVTSMVGLLEPLVAWVHDRWAVPRHRATVYTLAALGATSVFSVLSYNVISDWQVWGFNLNGVLDFVSNQIMLPIGGLLIALFAGWFVSRATLSDELAMASPAMFSLWYLLIRFVAPIAIAVVLVTGLF
ncbi:MAG: sodium-dependent transporter [Proteobacteria bacterium]|jgi:NSS family neurotransmitter:Na+ symporter|nr:sodium-dependent transporter [Pseudomonadota bacterium]MDA1299644.1 sodium-dependent transporter [Pseudomonadota bacterium]